MGGRWRGLPVAFEARGRDEDTIVEIVLRVPLLESWACLPGQSRCERGKHEYSFRR